MLISINFIIMSITWQVTACCLIILIYDVYSE